MAKSIEAIIDGVIGREGKYSNHPSDRGGETMWGITAAVARRYGYTGAMNAMPRSTAAEIYRKVYVVEPGFDKVLSISPAIAIELIDTGVNMGTSIPGPWLQRVLNALNLQGKSYPDLKVDGAIGPATLGALRSLLAKRGKDGETVLLRALNCLQGARYLDITEKRQENEDFYFGWMLSRVEVA